MSNLAWSICWRMPKRPGFLEPLTFPERNRGLRICCSSVPLLFKARKPGEKTRIVGAAHIFVDGSIAWIRLPQ